MEATPGFEPGVKALQASALPLGLKVLCKREFKKLCYNVLRFAYQDRLKMICFAVVDQVLFETFL